jgi:hypothetical protein
MNSPYRIRVSLVLLLAFIIPGILGPAACRKPEPEIAIEDSLEAPMGSEMPAMPSPPTEWQVPPEVAATWKSVVLEVNEKATGKRESHTIRIGDKAVLGQSGLTAEVQVFLPDFAMANVFTSKSNDLNNPAARVKITDQTGTVLFQGFLFGLYPGTHAFPHPKYEVVLKDYLKK